MYRKPALLARDLSIERSCCLAGCDMKAPDPRNLPLPYFCAGARQNPDGSYTYAYDAGSGDGCTGFA